MTLISSLFLIVFLYPIKLKHFNQKNKKIGKGGPCIFEKFEILSYDMWGLLKV